MLLLGASATYVDILVALNQRFLLGFYSANKVVFLASTVPFSTAVYSLYHPVQLSAAACCRCDYSE